MNIWIIQGNLTKDPELKVLPSGSKVATVGVAVTRNYKDKTGNWVKDTQYIDIEAWDKGAEALSKLTKGDGVFVKGESKTDSWEDKVTKQKRTKVKLRAELVYKLEKTKVDVEVPAVADSEGENEPLF